MSQNENIESEQKQDEILASILQKISPPTQQPSYQSNTGGNILSTLLSNPELISKLPAILSSIKPILDMFTASGTVQSSIPTSATVAEPVLPPATEKDTPAGLVKHSHKADSRTALLCAMKPYLSHDRQNAIDYIVKIGKLGDILKTL
jgi:hypothetical protein